MMRLGLTSAAFYGRLETEDAAKKLWEFPVDTCEIFLETGSEYNREFGMLTREKLGSLHCRAVHAKGTQFESDLFGASKRQRQDAFQTLKGVLDCGQALGASVYVFHGLPDIRGGLRPKSIPRLYETVEHIVKLTGERNIRLAWENVAWCTLKRPEDAAYLKEACPQLFFVLDIKQAVRAAVDPFAFLPVMGDSLIHVHVLDFDPLGRLCLPGQGTFDFLRLRRELDAMDYQGDVILEPYAAQTEDEKALHTSICYLRKIFCDSPEEGAVSSPVAE
jgi:sugar phosphate isomerase/epimerase